MGIRFTEVATPSAPSSGKIQIYYDISDSVLKVINEASVISVLSSKYRLKQIINITNVATTTYTPSTGTKALYVECVGGGGGGGGTATATSSASCGSGGSGGGYAATWLTSLKSTYAITIGAAGVAGGPGGSTIFDTATPSCKAQGGVNGLSMTAGTAANIINSQNSFTAGIGDVTVDGNGGGPGIILSGTIGMGGSGGGGPWGGGGISRSAAGAGNAGQRYGGGGAGGCTVSGGSAVSGGVGFQGMMRIWEFQ